MGKPAEVVQQRREEVGFGAGGRFGDGQRACIGGRRLVEATAELTRHAELVEGRRSLHGGGPEITLGGLRRLPQQRDGPVVVPRLDEVPRIVGQRRARLSLRLAESLLVCRLSLRLRESPLVCRLSLRLRYRRRTPSRPPSATVRHVRDFGDSPVLISTNCVVYVESAGIKARPVKRGGSYG